VERVVIGVAVVIILVTNIKWNVQWKHI